MLFFKTDIVKPVAYISCGQFLSTGNWSHKKRNIDSFEIIYGIKGCAYLQQDDEKYVVSPGSVLLILPGHIHEGFRESVGEVSFYWMHFKCSENYEFFNDKSAQVQLTPFASGSYSNDICHFAMMPIFFKPAENEKLIILIKQLLHSAYAESYKTLVPNYLLTLILMELTQQAAACQLNTVQNVNSKKLNDIIEWLRINFDKNYTIETIARKFDFNKDYLRRIFKEHTGLPIVKYINGLKISEAKKCLMNSELSVKEISYTLGFSDEKYFMKLFKAYENITPTEFRNSYYRTHLNSK